MRSNQGPFDGQGDQVFPRLPVRQWVTSVPKRLCYPCGATTRYWA